MIAKAHKRAYMIHRAFISRNTDLVRAYIVYVRPLVEYNSVVWSPYTLQNIETTEQVQRRFTKNLPGCRKFSYKDRLQRLHLPSLVLRRLYFNLVWCYKILFRIVEIQAENFFVLSTYAPTRDYWYKLFKKPHLSRTRANFFSERILNAWNFLSDTVDSSFISSFERSIH